MADVVIFDSTIKTMRDALVTDENLDIQNTANSQQSVGPEEMSKEE